MVASVSGCRPARRGYSSGTNPTQESAANGCAVRLCWHRAVPFVRFYPLSCSPVQAAGIEIPCLFFKLFSMAALSRAGGTIMKRRLIML
jgi:hypothetical protein